MARVRWALVASNPDSCETCKASTPKMLKARRLGNAVAPNKRHSAEQQTYTQTPPEGAFHPWRYPATLHLTLQALGHLTFHSKLIRR